jgi:TolB-like protein
MSILVELQRRNVIRVAIFYIVSAWLFLQIADLMFEVLMVPDWTLRFLFGVLTLAFPFVLFLAWAYEMTPEGIKREADVDRSQSITGQTGKKLNVAVIVVVLLGVGAMLLGRQASTPDQIPDLVAEPAKPAPVAENSAAPTIAVLPFVNMSADAEQEFFSDGITEEILNVLVKIKGLQVTGRTSSFQFKGQNLDLRDIGTKLGVNHILEGSVRRFGDDLRITAQLVRSDNGFHLWSQTYDRKLDNVFAIQEEIALAIAEALRVPLGLQTGLVSNQTTDLEAYDLYLRGIAAFKRRGNALVEGMEVLTEATRRDPEFAAAWAGLALVNAVYFYYFPDLSQEETNQQLEAGLAAARKAIQLQPDNARAYVAMAAIYKEFGQWVQSDQAFRKALELDPSLSDVHQQYAEFLVIVGYYDRAAEHAQMAVELDPLVPIIANVLGYILSVDQRYDEAEIYLKRAIALDPGLPQGHNNLMDLHLARGEFELARKVVLANPNFDSVIREANLRFIDSREHPAGVFQAGLEVNLRGTRSPWRLMNEWGAILDQEIEHELPPGSGTIIADEGVWSVFPDPRFKIIMEKYGLVEFWRQNGWPDFCRPLAEDDFECGVGD